MEVAIQQQGTNAQRRRMEKMPTVSYSEMYAYGVCRQRHEWSYVRNIEPQGIEARPALGTAGHYALQRHYEGGSWQTALADWVQKQTERPMFDEERQQYEDIEITLGSVIPRYLAHWKNETLVPIAVEQEFNVKLAGLGVRLNGYWDLIVRDTQGRLWIQDYKFLRDGGFRKEFDLEMDLQIGTYHWAALELGIPIVGTIYDQIRAAIPARPALLKNGKGLSKGPLVTDYVTYLQAIMDHGFNPDDYTDHLDTLLTKRFFERHYIPRDPVETQAFGEDLQRRAWDMKKRKKITYMTPNKINCGSCAFKDLCLAKLRGRDAEALIESAFQPRTRRAANQPVNSEEVEV